MFNNGICFICPYLFELQLPKFVVRGRRGNCNLKKYNVAYNYNYYFYMKDDDLMDKI